MKRLIFLIVLVVILHACSNEQHKGQIQMQGNINVSKAYNFIQLGEVDSAFKYFNIAKREYVLLNDSIGAAYAMVNMAIIATNGGDYYGGQEISLSAMQYLNENNKAHQSNVYSNYNNLAEANYKLRNYTSALRFHNLSLKFVNDNKYRLIYLNNKAKVYEELKNYNEAIRIYARVLNETEKGTIPYAQALANIASTKWRQNPSYNAAPELLVALQINEKEGNQQGLNFCYARLADFYGEKNNAIAKSYAEKMYGIAKKLKSANDQIEALYKLVKLSPATESKNYFTIYEKIDDSLKMSIAKDKNQFALIRYDTLKLEKENSEKKYQLIKQKTLLIVGLTLALFISVISFILYKKRKQRVELASQNAIRENQLRTSKKVHDVVANGIYRVMTEIENNEDLNRLHVLDKLEDMYEKSRNLSYEELNYTNHNFHQKVAELLKSFAGETRKVVFVGNTEELWKNVNAQIKYEIKHILQELMVNMKKHSKASNVAIRFERKEAKIAIYYTDNGVGMLPKQHFKNGLTNTGNRIINIDGEITFDTKVEKGLKIQLSFPVS